MDDEGREWQLKEACPPIRDPVDINREGIITIRDLLNSERAQKTVIWKIIPSRRNYLDPAKLPH